MFELYSAQEGQANWQMVTDQVMGGVSVATMHSSAQGVSLQGQVSYENNGGFVQIKWPLPSDLNWAQYDGLYIEAKSSNALQVEAVLKSSQLWMPWQSYRVSLALSEQWQSFVLPFSQFAPYRTQTALNPSRLTQFALLAGQEGVVEFSVQRLALYRESSNE